MNEKNREYEDLQVIIDSYSDMLFKIAYLRLQNLQDAEDVIQEVFYQYLKRKEEYDSEEHKKAWLIKVTLNHCRKLWRSANRRRSCGVEDITTYREGIAVDKGVEEGIVSTENSQILLKAVMDLPVKYRDVIHLFYYEDLSVREIGEVTGRKESTITSQLTRGRELLKKRLKEEFDFA